MKMKGNQLKMRVNKKIAKVKKNGQGQKKIKCWPAEIGRGGTPAPRNQRPLPLLVQASHSLHMPLALQAGHRRGDGHITGIVLCVNG